MVAVSLKKKKHPTPPPPPPTHLLLLFSFFFFQAEDGIRDSSTSRGLGDVYKRQQSTRAFARNLSSHITIPIGFWDERLSTVAAEKALLEADTSRRRRAEVIDHVAASYILQGVLDRLCHIHAQNAAVTR